MGPEHGKAMMRGFALFFFVVFLVLTLAIWFLRKRVQHPTARVVLGVLMALTGVLLLASTLCGVLSI